MFLYDSDDGVDPGSYAESLLLRMSRRPQRDSSRSHRVGGDGMSAPRPGGLEAELLGAGVTSPFNTLQLEEALRQQASWAVDRRQHEIEACEQALHSALCELHRVRTAEEVKLAAHVSETTSHFHRQLDALQQSYLHEVEKLKRQAVSELRRQRVHSETVIAARVRALQGQLRHERPMGLSGSGPANVAQAPAGLVAVPAPVATAGAGAPGLGLQHECEQPRRQDKRQQRQQQPGKQVRYERPLGRSVGACMAVPATTQSQQGLLQQHRSPLRQQRQQQQPRTHYQQVWQLRRPEEEVEMEEKGGAEGDEGAEEEGDEVEWVEEWIGGGRRRLAGALEAGPGRPYAALRLRSAPLARPLHTGSCALASIVAAKAAAASAAVVGAAAAPSVPVAAGGAAGPNSPSVTTRVVRAGRR